MLFPHKKQLLISIFFFLLTIALEVVEPGMIPAPPRPTFYQQQQHHRQKQHNGNGSNDGSNYRNPYNTDTDVHDGDYRNPVNDDYRNLGKLDTVETARVNPGGNTRGGGATRASPEPVPRVPREHPHWSRLPVCRWCDCDPHRATVTCIGESGTNSGMKSGTPGPRPQKWPRVLRLPQWTRELHAVNISIGTRGMLRSGGEWNGDLPHFGDTPALRELRLERCGLTHLHPLSFVPLPGLEVLHVTGSPELRTLPPALLHPLTRLRVLDLSGNGLSTRTGLFEGSPDQPLLPPGVLLERLNLAGNPLGGDSGSPGGAKTIPGFRFPPTKRLVLSGTGARALNASGITFSAAAIEAIEGPNSDIFVPLDDTFWAPLESLDVGDNAQLELDVSALARFGRLRVLRVAGTTLPAAFPAWLASDANSLRHLDMAGARIRPSEAFRYPFEGLDNGSGNNNGDDDDWEAHRRWSYCGPHLEWLDISGVGVALDPFKNSQSAKGGVTTRNQSTWEEGRGAIESIRFSPFCPIKWLYADRNRIRSVDLMEGNPELMTLSLNDNLLVEFPLLRTKDSKEKTASEKTEKQKFLHVQTLALSRNHLGGVPRNLLEEFPALRTLSLGENHLTEFVLDVPRADSGHSLTTLNLSGNALTRVELVGEGALRALSVLDLSANRLLRFSLWALDWLPALEHLHLAHNPGIHFEQGDVSDPPSESGASDGRAAEPLVEDPNFLSHSSATNSRRHHGLELKPSAHVDTTLLELDLRGCSLRAQPDLRTFHALRLLDIGDNGLEALDGRLLPGGGTLSHVDAHGNRIRSMGNFSTGQLRALNTLELRGNPLRCHCPLQPELVPVLKQQPDIYDDDAYWCEDERTGWRYPLTVYLSLQNTVDCMWEWGTTATSAEGDGPSGGSRGGVDNMLSWLVTTALWALATAGGALLALAVGLLLWQWHLGGTGAAGDDVDYMDGGEEDVENGCDRGSRCNRNRRGGRGGGVIMRGLRVISVGHGGRGPFHYKRLPGCGGSTSASPGGASYRHFVTTTTEENGGCPRGGVPGGPLGPSPSIWWDHSADVAPFTPQRQHQNPHQSMPECVDV